MEKKTWNVRDQTEDRLRLEAEKLYKQIESKLEDAERINNQIWAMKKWTNDIELELIRREYKNEAQAADAGTN